MDKFFPALFGALTLLVVWKTIGELKGNLFALVLGASAVTFSILFRINILYQPNSFDILSWTMLYYCFARFINSYKSRWLWMAAACFAIGFLNKYNIVFLLLGFLPALLLTEHRRIFVNRTFYLSMALALLLILPNLVWQYQNNFPVIYHLKTLSDTQLVNVNRADFLREQIIFFMGSLFVLLAAFAAFAWFPPFKKYRVFGWSFIFTLLIFVYLKAKGYYAIGLYPIYLAFGSVYLEHLLNAGWKLYLRPVAVLVVVIIFIPFFKIAFPIERPEAIAKDHALLQKVGALRWEDGKDHLLPQDYADMLGWSELAHKTDSIFDALNSPGNTIIHCDNYGQAGAINYYSKHKDINALTENADYINWYPLDTKQIKNIILVKDTFDTDKGRLRERQFFKSVTTVGRIENIYAREQGTTIYLLKDATADINQILREEIAAEKASQ